MQSKLPAVQPPELPLNPSTQSTASPYRLVSEEGVPAHKEFPPVLQARLLGFYFILFRIFRIFFSSFSPRVLAAQSRCTHSPTYAALHRSITQSYLQGDSQGSLRRPMITPKSGKAARGELGMAHSYDSRAATSLAASAPTSSSLRMCACSSLQNLN